MSDNNKIVVLVRDINGKRDYYEFDNREALMMSSDYPELRSNDEDEILLVLWNDKIIYNQLQSSFSITWEDILGFFA